MAGIFQIFQIYYLAALHYKQPLLSLFCILPLSNPLSCPPASTQEPLIKLFPIYINLFSERSYVLTKTPFHKRIPSPNHPRWHQHPQRRSPIWPRPHEHRLVRTHPNQVRFCNRRLTIHLQYKAEADLANLVWL